MADRQVFDTAVSVTALTRGYVGGELREGDTRFMWPAGVPLGSWVRLNRFGGKGDHDGDGNVGGAHPPVPSQPAGLTIPENWPDLPAKERKALAEQISGSKVANAGEADTIISSHLLTRVKPVQPFDDAPAPQTITKSVGASGGAAIEPDWVPTAGGAVMASD